MTKLLNSKLPSGWELIIGDKQMANRQKQSVSVLDTLKELKSPVDPEVTFTIKKATNREDVKRANLFSTTRYKVDENGTEVAERDFEVGKLQMDTIELCLHKWNIEDNGRVVPITPDNLNEYILPKERVFLYEQILEHNPLWTTRGEE